MQEKIIFNTVSKFVNNFQTETTNLIVFIQQKRHKIQYMYFTTQRTIWKMLRRKVNNKVNLEPSIDN